MPVEEGRFGVRFRPGNPFDGGPSLKLPIICLAVMAAISFLTVRGCSRGRAKPVVPNAISESSARDSAAVKGLPARLPAPAKDASSANGKAAGAKQSPDAQEAPQGPTKEQKALSARWLKTANLRTSRAKTLLERLAAAERGGDEALIVSTLESMRSNPALADLEDALSRRLGELHSKRLVNGEDTLLVTALTARLGDSYERLARERGTTVAALRMLNPGARGDKPTPGDRLRSLNYPRCMLIVHTKIGFSDLYINEKFFRRYYGSVKEDAPRGPTQVTAETGVEDLLSHLGIKYSPPDLAEIAALLAPGAQVIVSTP